MPHHCQLHHIYSTSTSSHHPFPSLSVDSGSSDMHVCMSLLSAQCPQSSALRASFSARGRLITTLPPLCTRGLVPHQSPTPRRKQTCQALAYCLSTAGWQAERATRNTCKPLMRMATTTWGGKGRGRGGGEGRGAGRRRHRKKRMELLCSALTREVGPSAVEKPCPPYVS